MWRSRVGSVHIITRGGGAKMFYFLEDHVMRSPKMSEKMKMLAVQTLHFPAEEQNIKMTGSNR